MIKPLFRALSKIKYKPRNGDEIGDKNVLSLFKGLVKSPTRHRGTDENQNERDDSRKRDLPQTVFALIFNVKGKA